MSMNGIVDAVVTNLQSLRESEDTDLAVQKIENSSDSQVKKWCYELFEYDPDVDELVKARKDLLVRAEQGDEDTIDTVLG